VTGEQMRGSVWSGESAIAAAVACIPLPESSRTALLSRRERRKAERLTAGTRGRSWAWSSQRP
jgi:hypothetical protein